MQPVVSEKLALVGTQKYAINNTCRKDQNLTII